VAIDLAFLPGGEQASISDVDIAAVLRSWKAGRSLMRSCGIALPGMHEQVSDMSGQQAGLPVPGRVIRDDEGGGHTLKWTR
jgi:hypothetical protein